MMRFLTIIFFTLFCFGLSAPVFSAEKDLLQHDVAIIIGNKDYRDPSIPAVPYAARDARAFFYFVQDVLGIKANNIIYLEDATQAQFLSTLGRDGKYKGRIAQYIKPGISNLVLYYSGHGIKGLHDKNKYLLPIDVNIKTAEINGYSLDTLFRNLSNLNPKSLTLYLETGFSGNSDGGPLLRNASGIRIVSEENQKKNNNINLVLAASDDEIPSWDKETQHGLFTEYLLQGLYGKADNDDNGDITLSELATFLEREIPRQAKIKFNRRQTPVITGISPFILSRSAEGKPFPKRPALKTSHSATGAKAQAPETPTKVESVSHGLQMLQDILTRQSFSRQHPDVKTVTSLRYDNFHLDPALCRLETLMTFHHDQKIFENNQVSGVDVRNHLIVASLNKSHKTKERTLNTVDENLRQISSLVVYKYGPFTFVDRNDRNHFQKVSQQIKTLCDEQSKKK